MGDDFKLVKTPELIQEGIEERRNDQAFKDRWERRHEEERGLYDRLADGPQADVEAIVARVSFPGKEFRVGTMGDGFYVQIEYPEMDVVTGESAIQRGRKWYVSRDATKSEVVQTLFKACLASAEHQVREHFAYAGPCGTCEGTGQAPFRGSERVEDPTCPVCDGSGHGKPRAIFGPHFDSDVLYGICGKRANYDARPDPA
jgi:DnaJ-class molecular chaperone